jgi:cephalosporin hydroxylase
VSVPEQSESAVPESLDSERSDVVSRFTDLYHELRDQTLGRTRWLGVSVVKSPMDLLILQEIIAETRPSLIVETGVLAGGSAYYMATLLDLLGIEGQIVGIDIDLSAVSPHISGHPKVELIEGSSTDPKIVADIHERAQGRRVMVDLDSDHRAEHVAGELRALAHLVTPGCYLVVEDTWIGRTVRFDQGAGPAEALAEWLAEGQPFEVDRWRERLLLSHNGGGYLRRLGPEWTPPSGPPRLDRFLVPPLDAASGDGAGERDPLTPEQLERNRHEAEYAELRAYARKLEAELERLRAAE